MTQELQLGDLADLRKKVWRKSHSLKSVEAFEYASKKFSKFLETNKESDPYKILDNFVAWLDEQGLAHNTIKDYTTWAKRILEQTYEVDDKKFKEKVTMPTTQIPMDEKPNEEDLRKLLLHSRRKLKPFIALLKDTAARPLELLGLQRMHFNLEYNPPYLIIPDYLAKNNTEREVFFTPETKAILEDYLKNKGIKDPEQYVFLFRNPPSNEEGFQKAIGKAYDSIAASWRRLLSEPAFKHLNVIMRGRRKDRRYKIHLYSLKKFAFTKIADTIGEIAAHAIAGHKAYLITYYKKTREERAKDFQKLIPKLSVLTPEDIETKKKREEAEKSLQGLSSDQLDAVLKLTNDLAGRGSS